MFGGGKWRSKHFYLVRVFNNTVARRNNTFYTGVLKLDLWIPYNKRVFVYVGYINEYL